MDRPKDRFIHQSAFLFYFFMTAGVLIVAAGSLLQHYFACSGPLMRLYSSPSGRSERTAGFYRLSGQTGWRLKKKDRKKS